MEESVLIRAELILDRSNAFAEARRASTNKFSIVFKLEFLTRESLVSQLQMFPRSSTVLGASMLQNRFKTRLDLLTRSPHLQDTMGYPMGDTQAFSKALAHFKEQSSELFGLIREEERNKLRRWEDEKPAISVSSIMLWA